MLVFVLVLVMAAPLSCYQLLEVDVNGEETFFVDRGTVCKYSSKFSNLFRRMNSTTCPTRKLKVNLIDFPGGARGFELLTRFCHNNACITLTPFNICLLHTAACYMEMDQTVAVGVDGVGNLVQQTEKFLKEINYWSWNELLTTLKQCQETLKLEPSSSLLQKCIESLVGRLASASEASSCLSSSYSSDSSASANRFSCDTKSTDSLKNSLFRPTWWFEDLAFLSPELLQHAVKLMILQKIDNAVISKFLFFCHRSKLSAVVSDEKEKSKLTMSVIDMFYLLDWSVISFKILLGLLRITSSARVEKSCSAKLESMIGSRLDEATLDNLLMPSPNAMKCLYNVDLVLRLLKAFVHGGCGNMSIIRLRNVANLIDMYMSEVAPDPSLKPSKMLALATALPDFARESYDGVYRAIDMYIQVHSGLSKEDKFKICAALSYDKLSTVAVAHLAQNANFPSKPAVEVIICQHLKLKSVLRNVILEDYPQNFTSDVTKCIKDKSIKKTLAHSDTDNVNADNQKLKEDIHGMQWRVVELEKLCKTLQSQMSKIMKSRTGSQAGMRSLPKLCS